MPSAGMMTSWDKSELPAYKSPGARSHLVGRRNGEILQNRTERHGDVQGAHPLHWSVQMIEGLFVDTAADFGGDAEALMPLVHDNNPARFLNRLQQAFLVERHNRAWIDHFGADPLRSENVGR